MTIDLTTVGVVLVFSAPFYAMSWKMIIDITTMKEHIGAISETLIKIDSRLSALENCKYCLRAKLDEQCP